jgi:acetyl-CoA C-acetyltransferase
MSDALIIDGVRTPRGKGRESGGLHHVHPQELLAQCFTALQARQGFDPAEVDDVLAGNATNTGDHGGCIARLSVLAAGWPVEAPGLTLHRFCGSGQQAVNVAAMGIRAGFQRLVVAGGVESMSRFAPPAPGDAPNTMDGNNDHLRETYPLVPQGISADLIATLEGFSRQACDAYALSSQQRAGEAIATGRFDRSIVAVTNPDGSVALDHDEHPRPETTLEGLAKLPPAFAPMGAALFEPFASTFDEMCARVYPEIDGVHHVHHAGNSSGVVDGAAAMLLASEDYVAAHGLTPRARVVMAAAAGAEPVVMLTAPAAAARRCLERAGLGSEDIDLWEINEAFASVVLKAVRDLKLDEDRVNVNGGAIALGHPIGGTGPMLIETALDELERRDQTMALIAMCTGGGMATATIIERV